MIIPDKILHGKESRSIKVMLDSKSQNFIRSIRDEIILKVNPTSDIYSTDNKNYVTHISILSSFNEYSLNNGQIQYNKKKLNF